MIEQQSYSLSLLESLEQPSFSFIKCNFSPTMQYSICSKSFFITSTIISYSAIPFSLSGNKLESLYLSAHLSSSQSPFSSIMQIADQNVSCGQIPAPPEDFQQPQPGLKDSFCLQYSQVGNIPHFGVCAF